MASRKVDFAMAVRAAITAFAEAAERIGELDEIFEDSGYDAAGGDPIVDGDIEGHDVTATDLANASVFAKSLEAFLNNGTPSPLPYDYQSKLNAFRGM